MVQVCRSVFGKIVLSVSAKLKAEHRDELRVSLGQ